MGVKEDLPATNAVGWDISPGSARVNTVIMVGARTEKVEPRSATSATGSVILPVSVMRKRIAAISAMELDTLQGIAARNKIPVTIVMRSAIS